MAMFVKWFLVFASFQPHVSYRHVSYKKCVIQVFSRVSFLQLDFILAPTCIILIENNILLYAINVLHVFVHKG